MVRAFAATAVIAVAAELVGGPLHFRCFLFPLWRVEMDNSRSGTLLHLSHCPSDGVNWDECC